MLNQLKEALDRARPAINAQTSTIVKDAEGGCEKCRDYIGKGGLYEVMEAAVWEEFQDEIPSDPVIVECLDDKEYDEFCEYDMENNPWFERISKFL